METSDTAVPQPSLVGLRPSFGFGDRLGLATPGHVAAALGSRLTPFFAQQSVREMTRTERTPGQVMQAAQKALRAEAWQGDWGADADHLKTPEDVHNLAAAGFTFFTIDPSAYVNNAADALHGDALRDAVDAVVTGGAYESVGEIESLYLGQRHELQDIGVLAFENREALYRGVVKYGRAMAYAAEMAAAIAAAGTPHGSEIEVSVDETDTPTSALEHLFIGLELRRRGVPVVSVAPRFVGEFEKGIDYKGDLGVFEASLREHVAIARYCGPYKISVHSGSDKFRIYPILGRVCDDLLHVKTAGTSYLEALRVVVRTAPELFVEISEFARGRYDEDKVTYHVSAQLSRLHRPAELDLETREHEYLDTDDGRQVLHVTYGSVLTQGQSSDGRPFKEGILEVLAGNAELHRQVLAHHLGRHVQLLQKG